MKNDEKLTF